MSSAAPIDLRSDTVTRPDAEMRAAMAAAEVGDDVLDGDPTMRALEERAAERLGVEASLWVPSGSMGNLVALFLHLQRGDRFFASQQAHVLDSEIGTAAWLAGGMPQPLPWAAGPGRITAQAIRAAASGRGPYFALRNRLLCLENTHNTAGGTTTSPREHAELVSAARETGLLVHLDGARIWNAAVAQKTTPAELTRGVDTVQACLSKGLGAPVGSVVGGSADFVREARRVRKMLGGGVRQGGVLAAAGLVALERVDRLAEDHENAELLAGGLRELGWDVAVPETNIVMVHVPDAAKAVEECGRAGVLALSLGGRLRLITHCDVSRADVRRALDRIAAVARR